MRGGGRRAARPYPAGGEELLVGEDVTYERKIREIVVASRLESTLTKAEILHRLL
jgi:membrane carboxypeptidase/penicillin-binding protein